MKPKEYNLLINILGFSIFITPIVFFINKDYGWFLLAYNSLWVWILERK